MKKLTQQWYQPTKELVHQQERIQNHCLISLLMIANRWKYFEGWMILRWI